METSLLEQIAGTGAKDAYDLLPESIKCMHTRKEWMWMTDSQKAALVRNECVPEAFDE